MDLEINFPLEILSKNKNTLIRFSPIEGMNIRTPVVGLVPGFSTQFSKKVLAIYLELNKNFILTL